MNFVPLLGSFSFLLLSFLIGRGRGKLSTRGRPIRVTAANMASLKADESATVSWDSKSLTLEATDLTSVCSAHLYRDGKAWTETGGPWFTIRPAHGSGARRTPGWLEAFGIAGGEASKAIKAKFPGWRLTASLLSDADHFTLLMDETKHNCDEPALTWPAMVPRSGTKSGTTNPTFAQSYTPVAAHAFWVVNLRGLQVKF